VNVDGWSRQRLRIDQGEGTRIAIPRAAHWTERVSVRQRGLFGDAPRNLSCPLGGGPQDADVEDRPDRAPLGDGTEAHADTLAALGQALGDRHLDV
jgi:hypothetical protein